VRHKPSGGCGYFSSEGQSPCSKRQKPVRQIKRVLRLSSAAYLIEDVHEGQSIVTLQRHRGAHTLLRCQHLDEGV